jgi:2-isopropylmalate synthase
MRGRVKFKGTLNGLGERCGNANLTTLLPILLLKEPYASMFRTGVSVDALKGPDQGFADAG